MKSLINLTLSRLTNLAYLISSQQELDPGTELLSKGVVEAATAALPTPALTTTEFKTKLNDYALTETRDFIFNKKVPLLSQLIGHDLVLKKPARHASVYIDL